MPIINVKVSAQKSPELTRNIASLLSDLTVRLLKKKPELIAIAVDYVDHDSWVIAGKTLTEHGKNSFYFDIRITDETNTKDEKAQFIEQAYAGFAAILGNLHEESYIHVQDVRAAAYGFGGHTQEYRYHRQ